MPVQTILILAVGCATAIAFGLFVFLLFPQSKRAAEEAQVSEVVAASGPMQKSTLGSMLAAAAPKGYTGWIEKQIIFAGRPLGWSLSRVITWKIVLVLVGAFFGFLVVSIAGPQPFTVVIAVAGTVLMFFLPDVRINSRAHDRQRAITIALPDTLDQMTIAVEAGLGFDSAMAKAARGNEGPLAEELVRVLQDMSIGRTRRESFRELERRTSSEDLRRFVRAVVQADAHGVAIADVLRVQASEMRIRRRQRAEEQAQKIGVKILFPLIFCLLPVMFIVILTPAIVNIIRTFSG